MKNRSILLIAALTGLFFTGEALATTSAFRAERVDTKRNTQLTQIQNTIATIAATTGIDTSTVFVGPYMRPFVGASSVPTVTFTIAGSMSAAADSVNVGLDVGPTSSGPWTQVYAIGTAGSAGITLTNAACSVTKNVVNTTLPFMPWWRTRIRRTAGTALTSKTFYIFFPALTHVTN